jgi:arabinofuranosyltransferase
MWKNYGAISKKITRNIFCNMIISFIKSALENLNKIMSHKFSFTFKLSILSISFLTPLAVFSYINRNYQPDDALIYFRYIRNVLEGNGLVYNVGDRFNGLTSPLFTYILIVVSWITKNIQFSAMAISTSFLGFALVTGGLLLKQYSKFYYIAFAGLIATCSPYFYSTYGMETTQFIFLICLCIYLFEREKYLFLGLACSLLILTRIEGVFLILALTIEHIRLKRPFPKFQFFILPFLIIAAQYGFNKAYYGEIMPATGMVKIYQGQSGLWGEWPLAFLQVGYHKGVFFFSNVFLMIMLAASSIYGFYGFKHSTMNRIVISFLLLYSLAYIFFNVPNYHWYYAPYYFFAFIYSGIGINKLLESLFSWKNKILQYSQIGAIIILFLIFIFINIKNTLPKLGDVNIKSREYREVGIWLREHTPEHSNVAMIEVGIIGWYSNRYIIDMLGLVSPHNGKLIGQRNFGGWLNYYSPDYIIVHDHLWGPETGILSVLEKKIFVEVEDFNFPGLKLYKKEI